MSLGYGEFIESLSKQRDRIRSEYHLTLGEAISFLATVEPGTIVRFDRKQDGEFVYPGMSHSYRGYYSDLALTADGEPKSCRQLLKQLREANGNTYAGYKGGEFTMGDLTPLWMAEYGSCGPAILDARIEGGMAVLITKTVSV